MTGEVPPSMSGTCGCYLNGHIYIFGGCDDNGQTNQVRLICEETDAPHRVHVLVDVTDLFLCAFKIRNSELHF